MRKAKEDSAASFLARAATQRQACDPRRSNAFMKASCLLGWPRKNDLYNCVVGEKYFRNSQPRNVWQHSRFGNRTKRNARSTTLPDTEF